MPRYSIKRYGMKKALTNVLTLLSLLLWSSATTAQTPASQNIAQDAQMLFSTADYPAVERMAQGFLNSDARMPSGHWKIGQLFSGILGLFDGNINDDDFWDEMDRRTLGYMDAFPESSTATILRANLYSHKASEYRQGRYPRDVPSDEWALYRENIRLAREVLYAQGQKFSDNPQWYRLAIELQGASSVRSELFQQIVSDGISKHPEYQQIYTVAAHYFEKRWSGDPDLVEHFARVAVELTYETEGARLYPLIYISLWHDYYPNISLFLYLNPDWDMMKQGMLDTLERFPAEQNYQEFAHIACMKRDFPFLDTMLENIKAPPIADIWDDQFLFSSCSDTTMRPMTEEDLMKKMAQGIMLTVLLYLGYEPQHR